MNCSQCGAALKEGLRFCISCGAPTGAEALTAEDEALIAILERGLGQKYRIVSKIGSGGFANVYLGEHLQLGRKVAVKILHRGFAGDESVIERFRRESTSVAKLSHPNIIDIHDVGETEGIYYFVMRYIEGDSLARRMRKEGRISPGVAVRIVQQVADALAYAHDHSVIHRDIKPANVMLDQFGKPVLMDFGIARIQLERNLTRTGALMGTPTYLPPETPLGRPIDGRSDIYSLGVMFYEMLAGQPPFTQENPVSLIFQHVHENAPALQSQVPDLDPAVCAVVHRMLEKQPEDRYQSASDLVRALEALGYPTTPTQGSYVKPAELDQHPPTLQLQRMAIPPSSPPARPHPAPAAPPAPAVAPRPEPAYAPAQVKSERGFPMFLVIGGAGILVAAIVLFALYFGKTKPPTDPPTGGQGTTTTTTTTTDNPADPGNTQPPLTIRISIDSQPWAEIQIVSGDSAQTYMETTPCTMDLPAGSYSILFRSPNASFQEFSRTIQVGETSTNFRFKFDNLNPEQLAETLLQ